MRNSVTQISKLYARKLRTVRKFVGPGGALVPAGVLETEFMPLGCQGGTNVEEKMKKLRKAY